MGGGGGAGDEDSVEGEGAAGANEGGVDVEAFDGVGVAGREAGEAGEGRVEVCGGLAAKARQERVGGELVYGAGRQFGGRRDRRPRAPLSRASHA